MSTNVETNNTRITAVSAITRRRERNSLSGLCATEFLSRESQKYRANTTPIKGSATIYYSRYLIRKMVMKNADKIALRRQKKVRLTEEYVLKNHLWTPRVGQQHPHKNSRQ